MTDDERRVAARAPIELKVEYKRVNTFFADYTRNISRGGTFIRTDKPLEVGTEFVFALVVPHIGEPLRLKGQVQWVTRTDEAALPTPTLPVSGPVERADRGRRDTTRRGFGLVARVMP